MFSRMRALIGGYPELATVLAAAAIGLTVQPPLAWLASRQGINIALAVLVFATGVTISPAALGRIATAWRSLARAVVVGASVLPALSWAISLIAPAGPLRDGLATVGLAPCEIASVATTAMAGGEAALSAGVLIFSTLTTVISAGPILSLEAPSLGAPSPGALSSAAGHHGVSPGSVIGSLALIVALPLAAGILLRARVPSVARYERPAGTTALVTVALLVALIAGEVHVSAGYLPVGAGLVSFCIGSAAIGWVLGLRSGRPGRAALLLTTSMRDFAIAAGLAAAAVGTAAAGPLGLYGILVLVWGTAAAGYLRALSTRQPQGQQHG
jgi:BASS family bile acid:Na+ symporter